MSSDSDSDGVAPGGGGLSSLTAAQNEDLARFGLSMSPLAKLSRPWRISADVHPTLGPPALREELRRHPGGRYDRKGRRRYWTGKNFDDVVGAFRRVARGVPVGNIPWEAGPSCHRAAATAAATLPASSEVPLPPEQAALHQDGDPADTPGLLAALAQSAEETVRAAAEEALDEALAVAAVQQVVALEAVAEEDDWLLSNSDDDTDGGGDTAVMDLTEED
ncbi:hypothetical protein ZWY2020_021597 [Hordeum vulgare]|nr:hypothetical protein ZWY2020_021597 [Hordeum vulgare]